MGKGAKVEAQKEVEVLTWLEIVASLLLIIETLFNWSST